MTAPSPLSLALDAPPESVTSRALLKAAGGSVTLFAFSEGESLGEHATPREALLTLLSGRAEVTIGGEAHALSENEAVRLPAAVPHDVRAVEPSRMLLVTLRA